LHLENRKWAQLKNRYGVTRVEWETLFNGQKGLCALDSCKQPARVVDHDHKTSRVRGLLCLTHNTGLGCFADNIQSLQDGIKYLETANLYRRN
jgi:hypothetical protein